MRSFHVGVLAVGAFLGFAGACQTPEPKAPERDKTADQFFRRATEDFEGARVDEAQDSIERALAIAPNDAELQTLGGRIAMARLEFGESLRLLHNVPGSEAQGLRGRAYWYRGELAPAADELEAMLNDPTVRDEWARSVAGLARSGEGRAPYSHGGDPRAILDMAQVSMTAPYLVVGLEVDGEEGLALIATNVEDVLIDANTHPQPNWVSLRFKEPSRGSTRRPNIVELNDVPALPHDLSGLSREVNANLKALIGVNVLRQLNVTVDFAARQLVVRKDEVPPPPDSTRVRVMYSRGGGMMLSTGLGDSDDQTGTFFVDSTSRYPLNVDEAGLGKAGIKTAELAQYAADPSSKLKQGVVELVRLGAFDLKKVPAIFGGPLDEVEDQLKFNVDGVMGVPLLAFYRFTFSDGGRVLYLEDDSQVRRMAAELEDAGPILAPPDNTTDTPLVPGVVPAVPGVVP